MFGVCRREMRARDGRSLRSGRLGHAGLGVAETAACFQGLSVDRTNGSGAWALVAWREVAWSG